MAFLLMKNGQNYQKKLKKLYSMAQMMMKSNLHMTMVMKNILIKKLSRELLITLKEDI